MRKLFFQSLMVLAVLSSAFIMGCKSNSEPVYNNPLLLQRADPMIVRAENGDYYFIATVPEYDRIELRKAKTINALAEAKPVVVWRKYETGPMSRNIWAPELHRIDGKWYIYFAAAPIEDFMGIRIYVLSNESVDPTQGAWVEEGQILTERGQFALDATTFEHYGERYMVWAEIVNDMGSTLVISKMSNPLTLEGPQVVISAPTHEWERQTYAVNEGAAVIKRNGKIFMTFSASATDHTYAMGLLWAKEDADLLDPASWTKLPEPVFYSNDKLKRFGPGHNNFTIAEDGKTDLLVYHARDYKEIEGNSLGDPNRHTRIRVLRWTKDGFPDFRQEDDDN
jgi:GH43 family beta-xylosidase